ncbi:MAG: hypothetical protein ABSE74_01085 [Methanoregula sp.]
MREPHWAHLRYTPIDYKAISYYSAPKQKTDGPKSLADVDPKLLATYDRLGVPCGTYTHISLVPHIYYIRDTHDIEPFCGIGEFIQPVQEVCRACGRCDRSKKA